jgi:hypothetical protein
VTQRWATIADGKNPEPAVNVPGLPPAGQIAEEVKQMLAKALGGE